MTPEEAILEMLTERGVGKTICPSEAARRMDPENWRDQMDRIRAAGIRMAAADIIEVTQQGVPISAGDAKGPIRYRLRSDDHRLPD
ncbi:MAG: DUF3253 domain-containing protein [Pseudomonadota bacterium]